MSQIHEGSTIPVEASGALSANRVVRLDGSSQVEYAVAASTDAIGVITEPALAADQVVALRHFNCNGSIKCVAHAAFSADAPVYLAAAGRIDDSGTVPIGVALEAATAQDDVIEVLPCPWTGTVARGSLIQDDSQSYIQPLLGTMVIYDAPDNPLTDTAGTDDLGLIAGTYGTSEPYLCSSDGKATTVSQNARFQFPVPPEYVDGETIHCKLLCGMLTTVSDTTATVALQCVRAAAPGVDICATAAADINNLTPAVVDFTLTPTDVVAGDLLDCIVTVGITDGATGTAVLGSIFRIGFEMDIKG